MPITGSTNFSIGNIGQDCQANGGRILISQVSTDANTSLTMVLLLDGSQVNSYSFPADTTGGSVTFDVLANGLYTLEARPTTSGIPEAVQSETYTIDCLVVPGCMDPSASNYDPNATYDDGTCVYPPVLGCTDPTATNYNPSATQDDGTCVYPIPGCTDPEALNYDPAATVEDGTCVYPVDVLVDALPEISAAGNPLQVVLHSRELTPIPVKAKVVLQLLDALAEGDTITINDVTFTAKNEPGFQNFFASTANVGKTRAQVMTSLAQAISEAAPLNYLYNIKQDGDTVTLEAIAVGTVYDITATSSVAGSVLSIITTAATDQYRSQSLPNWGCYVEVWARCGNDFGGATDKAGAVLLGRLEQLYQPGDNYVFDISELLQVEMGHALPASGGHMSDRMLSYFVKYGEIYGAGYRNRYYEGETPVRWAIEAALPLSAASYNWDQHLTAAPWKLLSMRPLTGQVFVGADGLIDWAGESFYFLVRSGAKPLRAHYALTWLYHDGTTTTATQAPVLITAGGVNRLDLMAQDIDSLELVKRVISCTLKLVIEQEDTPGAWSVASESEARTLTFYRAVSPEEVAHLLLFVNSLGGYDPIQLEGVAEPAIKRTAAQFNRSGAQRITRKVELDHSTRLSSGMLDKATFDWLRAELAQAPDVFYNSEPVNIADIDFTADQVSEEYFVSVTVGPAVGNNSLSN